MANSSKPTCPPNKTKNIFDPCCLPSVSNYLKCITTSSSQCTTSFLTTLFSTNMSNKKKVVHKDVISVEDKIEQSKVHWSQLTKHLDSNNEVIALSNMEFFKHLQKHHPCSYFFQTFGDGGIFDKGKLEVGEKFAEGGQAELYHAHVTWNNAKDNALGQKLGVGYVLKVFKKGTFLQDLQKQWPEGLFLEYEERFNTWLCEKSMSFRFDSGILCGTLLQDGRFAFLMVRENEDLRTRIDRTMKEKNSFEGGPFPMEMAFKIMYYIARGMDWLHSLNIVHRDLKASNVLCSDWNYNDGNILSYFCVADFECSIGVVGTGFFRAPEILQAIKDKVVNKKPNVFTKAGDVYGYGMVCYEILTGKLPFEGHPLHDYDLVLRGQQLEIPHHIDEWVHDLLHRCWQVDASKRPTFQEIIDILEAKSKDCIELRKIVDNKNALPFGEQTNFQYKY